MEQQTVDISENWVPEGARLSYDERMIVEILDKDYRTLKEMQQGIEESLGHLGFLENVERGTDTTTGLTPMEQVPPVVEDEAVEEGSGKTESSRSSCAEGGFGFAALLPALAPLVSPLVSGAVNAISGLFKKKKEGSGSRAPNARGGIIADSVDLPGLPLAVPGLRGQGSRAPNAVGRGRSNQQLIARQQSLHKLRGRKFWNELVSQAEDEVANQVLGMGNISVPFAQATAKRAITLVVPKSFILFVRRTDDGDDERVDGDLDVSADSETEGSGKTESSKTGESSEPPSPSDPSKSAPSLGSIVKPLMKWAIHKILQKQASKAMRRKIRRKIKRQGDIIDAQFANRYGVRGSGKFAKNARDWFSKVFRTAKRGLVQILPSLGKIAVSQAPKIIDRLFNKFSTGAPHDSEEADFEEEPEVEISPETGSGARKRACAKKASGGRIYALERLRSAPPLLSLRREEAAEAKPRSAGSGRSRVHKVNFTIERMSGEDSS